MIMPAAVIASSFYCDVDSDLSAGTVITSQVDCCTPNGLNNEAELSDDYNYIDHCTFLQDCDQSISDPFTELESILLVENNAKAVLFAVSFFDPLLANGTISQDTQDTSFSYSTPPIFLLNSTFLN